MTRGNIYVCDDFIAEIGSHAFPGGEVWDVLKAMDNERVTEAEFRERVTTFVRDCWGDDYLSPLGHMVGNWSYEFVWRPEIPPSDYKDWEHWQGRVYVRRPAPHVGYWQMPGQWMTLQEMERVDNEDAKALT